MQKNNHKLNTFRSPCRMQSSKGFYKWAWGIIEGCCNDCDYCYAHDRKNFNKLKFREDLLNEPYKVSPAMIFVNHLGDIMCYDSEIVRKIIDVCKELPKHTFLFMTKLPGMYELYSFPDNCVLGVTVESPDKWYRANIVSKYKRTMCSVEPILGDFTGKDFSLFEFVVIGCLIGTEDHSNYGTVNHRNIYYTR